MVWENQLVGEEREKHNIRENGKEAHPQPGTPLKRIMGPGIWLKEELHMTSICEALCSIPGTKYAVLMSLQSP